MPYIYLAQAEHILSYDLVVICTCSQIDHSWNMIHWQETVCHVFGHRPQHYMFVKEM